MARARVLRLTNTRAVQRSGRGAERHRESPATPAGEESSRARRSHEAITREASRLRSALTRLGSA